MSDIKEETPQPQTKPDWSIGELYRTSWQIVKKHKVLWLFGMALGAGVGSSFRSNSNFDQKDIESIQKLFQNNQHSTNQDLSMVLGTSTTALYDSLASIFSAVPLSLYALTVFELLLLLCVGIAISLIYQSWAEAGLLEGIQTAIANGTVSIRDTSEKAFRSIKDILLVRIVPTFILSIAAVLFFIVVILLSNIIGPLAFLIIFAGIIFAGFVFLMLTFSQTWATRKIVIEKIPAIQALRAGYHIATKKFWAMLLLGIINTLVRFAIIAAIIAPIIGMVAGGYLVLVLAGSQLGTPLLILGILLFILFIFASGIVGGILNAFVNTVWSLAYQNIKGKYDK